MTDTETARAMAKRVLTGTRPAATRRGLMCGLAGLGAAGALAACGTAEPPASGSTSDSTTGSTEESTEESTGGADSGGGEAIAATTDVPEGSGIVVDDTVLVQPTADEFLAFSAACPHAGTILNAPNADGVIICPNHGSEFSLEGALEKGPAETGLAEVEITVEDGQIFLA